MTALNTLNFDLLTQQFAAAVQAESDDLIDFSQGSILLAIAEANAANSLWLQALVTQALAATRAQTCSGIDLDTFCVQFMPALAGTVSAQLPNGTPRIQATAATGTVALSRFTPSASAPFIPDGSLVKTADGTQQFSVYADATNPNYSKALSGYSMPANIASILVPVQAVNLGTQGNIGAGTIALIASEIQGVDAVSNPAAFTNGSNQESDASLRARLALFFPSLSKGTDTAIEAAVFGVQAGMQCAIHENADPTQAIDYGAVTIYVDDGSGAPPVMTVQAAAAAVDAVRAASVRYQVLGSSILRVNYSMQITTAVGYVHQNVVAQVGATVNAMINGLGLEATLPYTQIGAAAWSVPGITNIQDVLLNGGTDDVVPSWGQSIKVGTFSIP